jgi:nicotinate phosphoribosyltransferase
MEGGLEQTLLLTDLYELSMLEAYAAHSMTETAVFELFVRKLPPERGFLMAAGLEQLVGFLEGMHVTPDELAWLRSLGDFAPDFLAHLAGLRFTGDVDAMPEGTIFFPDEPIVRVTAPPPQAQLIETRLLNLIHLQTVIASKAARMVLAASGKQLVDFGLRRAHGAEAGLLAARASYLAGFDATATVLANRMFGIPMVGTMAHSFIQAHDDEATAFERFARVRPRALTLLIDTYDTEHGAVLVTRLAPRLTAEGIEVVAVRIDSGDLAMHARRVRSILDAVGLTQVRIFASGGLDEHSLQRLCQANAPIDGFGVGTGLTTSADAPALDCAYKLQEYAARARRKHSEGKATWPGRKQVYRRYASDGTIAGDTVALLGETAEGEPLLCPVMRSGRRLAGQPALAEARARASASLSILPASLRQLVSGSVPVEISAGVRDLAGALDRQIGAMGDD